jgi:hypothetical protein
MNNSGNKDLIKIIQLGSDGFGHQLEGTLRLLSVSINKKANYQLNYDKNYSFEHTNFNISILKNYFSDALQNLSRDTNWSEDQSRNYTLKCVNQPWGKPFDEILKNDLNYNDYIYAYDGLDFGPPNFEKIELVADLEKSLPILRNAFVLKNTILPKATFDDKRINVCFHIRMGDAVGTRILENDKLINIVDYFQKNEKYRVTIHTDGDINNFKKDNAIIWGKETDVLQVLSDFIYADILVINYSSLSISAHFLADTNQLVICPKNADVQDRVLKKCINCDDFLSNPDYYLTNYYKSSHV